MRWIPALVVVLAACSKGKPDDCVIVREKPASAMAELSSRYPNDPVKVAETIERCVAPRGEDCDRIAKIVAAIPTLAPQLAAPSFDVVKTCKAAPPEFRRCLLPSYQLAHTDECKQVMQSALTELSIKPSTQREPAGADRCGFVALYITHDGTWLATGRDAKAWCFAPRKAGALDRDWLEARLRRARAHACGPSSAELAADNDVAYQDAITVMDIAVKTGFVDVGLSSPSELSVPLATAKASGAPGECPDSLIAAEPAPQGSGVPTAPAPAGSGPDRLASAPVVIITKDAVTLNAGGTSTEIAKVADVRSTAKLDALTKALPPAHDGLLILQADTTTPASVINAVVTTAKAAGYDNVLFAVKNK